MTRARDTPLHHLHARLGASFTTFAGWNMPVRYTSDIAEHHAVRSAAGLFDLSHMGQIELEGPGAARALDAGLVGWLSKLGLGKAKYTMMCDNNGGVVDDLVVYRTGDEQFLVVANAGNHAAVLTRLADCAAPYETTVVDRSLTDALLAIQGPASVDILQLITGAPVEDLKYYGILDADICDVPVRIARTGYTGEDGFEIYLDATAAAEIWQHLLEAGEPHGLAPAGLACRDTLRLESGMPLYGHELDIACTPFDAGLERIVALDKPGDFVGRSALMQRSTKEAVRALVGLRLDGPRIARQHQTVLGGGTDELVGKITSGAPSPTLGHPIAMARVDRNFSTPGTELAVDVRGRREPARVVELPFYRRSR